MVFVEPSDNIYLCDNSFYFKTNRMNKTVQKYSEIKHEIIDGAVPSYNKVLDEIVTQLRKRNKDIFKRALLVLWPYIILFIAIFVFITTNRRAGTEGYFQLLAVYLIFLGFWVLFSFVYSFVIGEIIYLERTIWVDSYFDMKNLDSKKSFFIAKKIFWTALGIKIKLIFQFYFLPIVLYIVAIGIGLYAMSSDQEPIGSIATWSFWLVIFVGFVLNWLYFYYLDIKLRYFWFIFLDRYGSENFSYKKIIDETKKLGKANEGEIFKKTFLISLGADSLNQLSKAITNRIIDQLAKLGSGAGITGKVLKIYSEEVFHQITSLSKITAKYVFYRHARMKMGHNKHEVNNNIYNIE